jgi:hypothetical protein
MSCNNLLLLHRNCFLLINMLENGMSGVLLLSPCLKIGKCAITFNKLSDYLVTLDTGKWNKNSSWI